MKFALVGCSAEMVGLVRTAIESVAHTFVAVFDVAPTDESAAELRELLPVAEWHEEWETLLHSPHAEAVLVAPGDLERRADQLRKLTQAGLPLFVIHPACEALVGFELGMIREDTKGVIVPYLPEAWHPGIAALSDLVRAGKTSAIGNAEQLAIERQLPDRSRPQLLRQLARDAELARTVLGRLNKVNAIGTDANLTVHLAGPSGLIARWSAESTTGREATAKVTLSGDAGRAVLWLGTSDSRLEIQSGGETSVAWDSRQRTESKNEPARAGSACYEIGWRQFAMAMAQRDKDGHWPAKLPSPNWQDACRASEIAETVEYSLKRGRTIELHHETHSEKDTFKGMMSAGSCLLLMLTLLFLLVFALYDGVQAPYRDAPMVTPSQGIGIAAPPAASRGSLLWRMWPVYPLAGFLLLQLLLFVFASPPKDREEKE